MSAPTSLSGWSNEIDPAAVAILRELIDRNVIAPGDVDDRSIKDVQPGDLAGYTQCHFFAGGGLWSVAARLAGWPDDRPLWTGSCPCQPFSAAGKGLGADDPRHLWPDFHRLIGACRPVVVMGEQVAGAAGYGWFDGVRADLARESYASRGVDIPACAVDAPHQRNRLYWLACLQSDTDSCGCSGRSEDAERLQKERAVIERSHDGLQPNPDRQRKLQRQGTVSDERRRPLHHHDAPPNGSWWAGSEWIISPLDGKARRAKPGIPFLVNGLPGRVDLWRVGGNAIVPILAAEVIAAFLDAEAIGDLAS